MVAIINPIIGRGSGGKSRIFVDYLNATSRTITFDITEYKKLVWVIQCHSQSGNTSNVSVKLRNKQGRERVIYSNGSIKSGTKSKVIDIENDTHIIYSRGHNWSNNTSFTAFATTDDELIT